MTTDWLLFDAVRAEAEYRAEQMKGATGGRTKQDVSVRRRLPWRRRASTTSADIPRPRPAEQPAEQEEKEAATVARRRGR